MTSSKSKFVCCSCFCDMVILNVQLLPIWAQYMQVYVGHLGIQNTSKDHKLGNFIKL
jgi:hypothetical protein